MLTILTPTYNRVDLLERLFLSLLDQTNQDFLWIIVDDGSDDGTRESVQKMKERALFSIEYYFQENSGKPTAFNQGVLHTVTEFVACIDSDDWLPNNGIELMIEGIKNYGKSDTPALVFQCMYENKELVTNNMFPNSPWYGTMHELVYKKKVVGDTSIVFNTTILTKELFPKYDSEKFVPEALIINRLSQHGDFCFINKVTKIIEYQADGFSANMGELFKENPQGYYYYAVEFLNLFSNDLIQMLRHIAAVGVFGKKIGKKVSETIKDLHKVSHKIFYIMMLPLILVYRL